ncbi:hypothetical protein D9M68_839930 [compost metagenome]
MHPAHHHPRQRADAAAAWGGALGLAEVAAVRGRPEDADGLSACGLQWVDLEHVGDVVPGVGVVRAVDGNGYRVVVDGDVGITVDPGASATGSAGAGEQIDVQFMHER